MAKENVCKRHRFDSIDNNKVWSNILIFNNVFPDYSYPYIIIILSMMSSASHFSSKPKQTMEELFRSIYKDQRNGVILFGHWLLHAYGIISITGFNDPLYDGLPLLLVPAPAAFYILTAPFTDPLKFHSD